MEPNHNNCADAKIKQQHNTKVKQNNEFYVISITYNL